MARWQMACNRVTRSCGCATWLQWEAGAWTRRHHRCHRHEG